MVLVDKAGTWSLEARERGQSELARLEGPLMILGVASTITSLPRVVGELGRWREQLEPGLEAGGQAEAGCGSQRPWKLLGPGG